MEIKVDETLLQDTINDKIHLAIKSAIGDYSVKDAVAARITSEFAHGVIAEALDKAMQSINVTALTTSLANEIAKATTRAAVMVLTDGLVSTLLRIRNIPDYDRDRYDAARIEIRAQLEGK
jgi:hypothetical protein